MALGATEFSEVGREEPDFLRERQLMQRWRLGLRLGLGLGGRTTVRSCRLPIRRRVGVLLLHSTVVRHNGGVMLPPRSLPTAIHWHAARCVPRRGGTHAPPRAAPRSRTRAPHGHRETQPTRADAGGGRCRAAYSCTYPHSRIERRRNQGGVAVVKSSHVHLHGYSSGSRPSHFTL
eukprot:COSAG02_NODE_641_length_19049_cov_119.025541_2_plen_176_part_00